jgi:hypothetical protein
MCINLHVIHLFQVLRADGTHLRRFGTFGRDHGQFNTLQGLVAHAEAGLLYVADTCNHRLQVLNVLVWVGYFFSKDEGKLTSSAREMIRLMFLCCIHVYMHHIHAHTCTTHTHTHAHIARACIYTQIPELNVQTMPYTLQVFSFRKSDGTDLKLVKIIGKEGKADGQFR